MENPHFGSKIKIPKNMSKSILQFTQSCSVQKTARKNTKYSRNESIFKIGHHAKALARKNTKYSKNEIMLKIGHHAKAIAHAKSSRWVKKLKFQKTCQNPFYKSFRVFLCKKPLEKTPNIQEMRLC